MLAYTNMHSCAHSCADAQKAHAHTLACTHTYMHVQVRSISYYANRYGGILLPGDHKPNVAAIERIFQVCTHLGP